MTRNLTSCDVFYLPFLGFATFIWLFETTEVGVLELSLLLVNLELDEDDKEDDLTEDLSKTGFVFFCWFVPDGLLDNVASLVTVLGFFSGGTLDEFFSGVVSLLTDKVNYKFWFLKKKSGIL